MLKNNIEVDVKVKCIEAATTQAKLAEEVGTTPSYVSDISFMFPCFLVSVTVYYL